MTCGEPVGNGGNEIALYAAQHRPAALPADDDEPTCRSPVSYTHLDVYKRQAPGCTIEAVTTAEAEGGPGTAYLRERSVVRAPRLLLGYMAGQAEHAHRLTMQRLPEVLARAT